MTNTTTDDKKPVVVPVPPRPTAKAIEALARVMCTSAWGNPDTQCFDATLLKRGPMRCIAIPGKDYIVPAWGFYAQLAEIALVNAATK